MKRTDPEKIGDVLRQTLSNSGLTDRLYETRAINLWPSVVGDEIAALSSRPMIFKRIMTVYVRNAALRQELNMSRSSLVKIINETLGREVITDIRFR
ncbi:MAG: DUF721 domain-containing protein [Bacteroides sp.]|nr:DUF721 domain-containing protein [Bacteroidales bacterium]MBD5204840.1 DUF721 domain-containing protein [Bacteroidales bacterium]MBD5302121.1 DUF721 domain-containing protein [Bacteroides sp.]MBD5305750.1 DUF721 domain-containing protein [Bacteroides sp.]MBD5348181.1 DUF721 domain-containing protein [Bacteroides sp.]